MTLNELGKVIAELQKNNFGEENLVLEEGGQTIGLYKEEVKENDEHKIMYINQLLVTRICMYDTFEECMIKFYCNKLINNTQE